MGFGIANNLNANQIAEQLNATDREQASTDTELSTGRAINSPVDNPAAYAIATNQETQIESYDQANANVQDAANAASTASDALASISNNLSQLNSLAIQANNSLNSSADNAAIQDQVNQLVDQINTTAGNTQFNGRPLLDGSLSNGSVQTGPNPGDQGSLTIPNSSANALGVAGLDVVNGDPTTIQNAISAASTSVLNTQANLGSSIIGFQQAAQNNAVTAVNLQAAQSSLTDANIAALSSQATNVHLKSQYDTALLAQGNISQYSVLNLVHS